MARRPDINGRDDVLSREDLEALGNSLAHLSPSRVRDFYERAYQRCRISDRAFPTARAIQELDQAWKLLRKWRF
jgi:hypothetical protein